MKTAARPDAGQRLSDAELVAGTLAGDLRALEALMRRYNRTLYRTARAILRDDAEAEDAVQEAYLRAYRALDTFRGESKFSTWLVRIAANEALMRRRKRARTASVVPIGAGESREEPMSEESGPEENAQRGETRRLLEKRIDALPDDFRAVFVLRAIEELSGEETAAALGIPEATVRTRFFRARPAARVARAGDRPRPGRRVWLRRRALRPHGGERPREDQGRNVEPRFVHPMCATPTHKGDTT